MSWLLAGLLVGVLVAGWFGYERQREVYEQLVRTLENDRDAARSEAKVFRGLLFPVLNRVDAPAALLEQPDERSPAKRQVRSHIPFRLRFDQIRKVMNTRQQSTDALAAALAKQKPLNPVLEKKHVAS